MALTGTFLADFNSFTRACADADVALKGFETNANKVGSSLDKMVDSLAGRKIVQEATLAAQAVDLIGGSSKLTDTELQRMATIAAEAAAKLRAMGEEVPPKIANLAGELKQATSAQQAMSGVARTLLSDMIALFSIDKIASWVKGIFDSASALVDLSQETHTSVEEIQTLGGAMSEFGVDQDTLAKGMYKLSRGIAGGDDSVTHGLAMMGLALKDVEGLQGEQLFLKVEHGLAQLQGGLRDTAAADIFGGKLGAAMARASEGIDETVDKWKRLNTVASTESVQAMDAFGESIARASKNLDAIAANMIGPVAQGFNVLFDAVDKGASKWAVLKAVALDYVSAAIGQTGTEHLTQLLDQQNKTIDLTNVKLAATAALHGEVAKAVDTRTQAEKFMAALEANAAKDLTATQLQDLAYLKEIGQLNAKNAEGIGVSTAQFEKYKAGIEAATKAAQDLKQAHAELDSTSTTAYETQIALLKSMEQAKAKAYGLDEQIAMLQRLALAEDDETRHVLTNLDAEKSRAKVRADAAKNQLDITNQIMALELKRADTVNKAVVAEFDAQQKLLEPYRAQATALDTLNVKLAALHTAKAEGISQTAQEQVLYNEYTKALYDDAVAQDRDRDALAAKNAERDNEIDKLHQATAAYQAYQGGVKLPGSSTETAFGQNYLISPSGGRVPLGPHGELPRNFDALYSGVSTIPQFAGGVRDFGGGLAIVGERGPELVNLPRGSSVTPNGAGGAPIVNHFYVNGTAEDVARQIAQRLSTQLRRGLKL